MQMISQNLKLSTSLSGSLYVGTAHQTSAPSPGPVAILRHVSPALLTVCPVPLPVLFSLLPAPSLFSFPPLSSPSSDVHDEIFSTPGASEAWKQYQTFKREDIKQVAEMYCRLAKATGLDITADTPFNLILAPKMGLFVDPVCGNVPMAASATMVPAGKCTDKILLVPPQAEHEKVKVKSVRWMGENEDRKLACASIVEYELDKEEVRVKQECLRQVLRDIKKNKQQIQIELVAAKNAERRKVSACSHVERMRKAMCLKSAGSIWGCRAIPVHSSRFSRCAGGRPQPVCLGGQKKH